MFGQSNMHITLDFCPRTARKETNVPLHKENLRAYCPNKYSVRAKLCWNIFVIRPDFAAGVKTLQSFNLDKTKMLKCVTKDLVKSSISFEIRFCLLGWLQARQQWLDILKATLINSGDKIILKSYLNFYSISISSHSIQSNSRLMMANLNNLFSDGIFSYRIVACSNTRY